MAHATAVSAAVAATIRRVTTSVGQTSTHSPSRSHLLSMRRSIRALPSTILQDAFVAMGDADFAADAVARVDRQRGDEQLLGLRGSSWMNLPMALAVSRCGGVDLEIQLPA